MLNVFRGGFTRDAAAHMTVGNDSFGIVLDDFQLDDVLRLLQRWEFVDRDIDTGRFSIHALVLSGIGENEAAYDAHYNFYKSLAMEQSQRDDFHGLDPDIENLTAAFDRKLEQGEFRKAFFLCQNCVRLFFNRMRFEEWQEMLERVRGPIEAEGDDELKAHLSEALGDSSAGTLVGERGKNFRHAITHYEMALEYFTTVENVRKCTVLSHNIGHAYQMLFALEEDVKHLRFAVMCFQSTLEFIEPAESAPTWNNLGLCHFQIGELERDADSLNAAIKFFQRAIAISSDRKSDLRKANSLNSLANAYVALARYGDFEENVNKALSLYQDSMKLATPETDPLAFSLARFNRGKLKCELAIRDHSQIHMNEAVADFEVALEYCSASYAPDQRGKILHALGLAKFNLDFVDEAIKIWTEANECFVVASNAKLSHMIQQLIADAKKAL